MNDCNGCDGFGIMTLWNGLRKITAPCLVCSPDAKLADLEAAKEAEADRQRIREHNAKLGGLR
jgi:hypothetical protein